MPNRFYYRPAPCSFWKWVDGARVLTWSDDTTIGFREEVAHVLARVVPIGLPAFGSIALLLAACRRSWWDDERGRRTLRALARRLDRATRAIAPNFIAHMLHEMVDDDIDDPVDSLAALAEAVIVRLDGLVATARPSGSVERAALLAELVAEHTPLRESSEEATRQLATLRAGLTRLDAQPEESQKPEILSVAPFMRTLLTLSLALGRIRLTPETLELRERAGVEALPRPADVELPPGRRARALIDALRDDAKLGRFSALCRSVLAAIALPRTLFEADELPTGGFSDIASRGTLDRLLPSELAHDDTTLAVRLVMNEALFFRRETPPASRAAERLILVDCGIRLWGVARVFAAAVALGLVASTSDGAIVHVFRHGRRGLEPADLTTRSGVIEHLAELELDPHPGRSLAPFAARRAAAGPDAASVIVTHENTLEDREFAAALARPSLDDVLVATVAASGRLRLWRVASGGRRVLTEARLDLESVRGDPQHEEAAQ